MKCKTIYLPVTSGELVMWVWAYRSQVYGRAERLAWVTCLHSRSSYLSTAGPRVANLPSLVQKALATCPGSMLV